MVEDSLLSLQEVENIPDDPVHGLAYLLNTISEKFSKGANINYDMLLVGCEYVMVYLAEHPKLIDVEAPGKRDYTTLSQYWKSVLLSFKVMRARRQMQDRLKVGRALVPLSSGFKQQIREMIGQIRRILDEVDIPALRKHDIISKLNAFSNELEREVASIDRLGALWLATTRYAGEGAKALDPAVRLIERVRKIMGSAQDDDDHSRMIEARNKKMLPSPHSEGNGLVDASDAPGDLTEN